MQIMGTGIDYSTDTPLVRGIDEQVFAATIQKALERNAAEIRDLTRASTTAVTYRSEIERQRTDDLGDPNTAGWTFLVNANDPQYHDILRVLQRLAEYRGMPNPIDPLTFHDEPSEEWFDWLIENYSSLSLSKVPHYILIVGGPDQVPFRFQSLLASAASVGRVAFDSLDDLQTYIEKIIRLEHAAEPVVTRDILFFAPDGGPEDATHFSRLYMAEPLAEHVRTRIALPARTIAGDNATKENFFTALRGTRPTLVYTASHGLGAPAESLEVQKRFNGAICCQHTAGQPVRDWLFSAEDVPLDEPFLEGAVFFQFACFGYGTPAESDFNHWLSKPGLNANADLVSALPKRLLAHPRGPVSFIGHVDTAWLHGFDDPENPHILERWHPRIEPFVRAVNVLLGVQPTGLAMRDMCMRYNITNAQLTSTIDRLQRGKIKVTSDFQARLASVFITRSDAQNYMIFGDPAARLRIPDA